MQAVACSGLQFHSHLYDKHLQNQADKLCDCSIFEEAMLFNNSSFQQHTSLKEKRRLVHNKLYNLLLTSALLHCIRNFSIISELNKEFSAI